MRRFSHSAYSIGSGKNLPQKRQRYFCTPFLYLPHLGGLLFSEPHFPHFIRKFYHNFRQKSTHFICIVIVLYNKQGSESVFNGNFTRYPKGAKVIYISPNLPKATSENISITAQECAALVQDENTVGHIKIHKYYDSACRRVRLAVDKMVLIQILKKGGLRK